jgi:predicted nucleotidyltransferase
VSHGVPEPLIEQLTAALTPRAEVLEAYLFGSVARGEASAHSDVDVAVYVTDDALNAPGFGYAAELSADLQQALGRPDIDLVVLNRATPLLYHRVLRDGVRVLSRDLTATTRREGYAFSRYCDDLPRLRLIEEAHRARVRSGKLGR